MSHEDIPVKILDRQVQNLGIKEVGLVIDLWRNQFVEQEISEGEEDIKKRYPHIFKSDKNSNQGTKFSY